MNNYKIIKYLFKNVGVQLYLLPLDENIKYINKTIIPTDQLTDIYQYKKQEDINKRLLARSFLYEFLNKHYAIKDFELSFNEYLKPFFKMLPTIHFSFSYSNEYVFIGVCNSKIGIDIEYIDLKMEISEMAPDIMCEKELAFFYSLKEKPYDQYTYFFKIFSAKESIIKAFGTGLYFDVKKINVFDQDQFIYNTEKFIQKTVNLGQNAYSMSICYQVEV